MKKFYIFTAVAVVLTAGVFALGCAVDWWQASSPEGWLGLIAVLPAVLWMFFKGVNVFNSLLYCAGFDYIIFGKFTALGGSVAVIVIEAVVIIACIVISCIMKNKALDAELVGGNDG